MTPDLHELARVMADSQMADFTPDEFLDEATAVLESDWLKARDARIAAEARTAAARDAVEAWTSDGFAVLFDRGLTPHQRVGKWLRSRVDDAEGDAL